MTTTTAWPASHDDPNHEQNKKYNPLRFFLNAFYDFVISTLCSNGWFGQFWTVLDSFETHWLLGMLCGCSGWCTTFLFLTMRKCWVTIVSYEIFVFEIVWEIHNAIKAMGELFSNFQWIWYDWQFGIVLNSFGQFWTVLELNFMKIPQNPRFRQPLQNEPMQLRKNCSERLCAGPRSTEQCCRRYRPPLESYRK